jgi:hypothetical protein
MHARLFTYILSNWSNNKSNRHGFRSILRTARWQVQSLNRWISNNTDVSSVSEATQWQESELKQTKQLQWCKVSTTNNPVADSRRIQIKQKQQWCHQYHKQPGGRLKTYANETKTTVVSDQHHKQPGDRFKTYITEAKKTMVSGPYQKQPGSRSRD